MALLRLILVSTMLLFQSVGFVYATGPVKIRVAWIAAPTNLAPILFMKDGIAKHLGRSYTLETVRFNGSPQMLTAIAANDLDIADLSYSSFALAIENGGMHDLRVVADDFQGNVPGYFSDGFLVLKNSPINSIKDLRGKVLATNGVGGAIDIALRTALLRNGLEDKRDVTIIEAPLPAMKAMLIEKKADLVPAAVPFAHDPELKNASRLLFTQNEFVGRTQTLLWAAKTSFINNNRAALVDFFEDMLRARRFFLDPANRKEAIQIVAKFTRQPPSVYEDWVFTNEDAYRDPNGLPSVEAMQSNINLQKEIGFLKNSLNVSDYLDLSMVKEAAARLK